MTRLDFWRALKATDETRIIGVREVGKVDGDDREWVQVVWSWAGFKGMFPLTEAGLRLAQQRLEARQAEGVMA